VVDRRLSCAPARVESWARLLLAGSARGELPATSGD
jgi:hypothetical protein